jgi:hypothetical protein
VRDLARELPGALGNGCAQDDADSGVEGLADVQIIQSPSEKLRRTYNSLTLAHQFSLLAGLVFHDVTRHGARRNG